MRQLSRSAVLLACLSLAPASAAAGEDLAILDEASDASASADEDAGPAQGSSGDEDDGLHPRALVLVGAGLDGFYEVGGGARLGAGWAWQGWLWPTLDVGLLFFDADGSQASEPADAAWVVHATANAGLGIRLPLVVVEPALGAGLARASYERCGDAACTTDDSVAVLVSPSLLVTTSPTSPFAPFTLGAELRGAFVPAAAGPPSGISLMAAMGVRL